MRAAQVLLFRPYFGATITISVVISFLIFVNAVFREQFESDTHSAEGVRESRAVAAIDAAAAG